MPIETVPEWQLTKADEAEIAALLARCFPTDFGGRSFFQVRQHLRLLHRQEGRILGHMAIQFRAMRLGERLVTAACLADVATDPDHRGVGIAAGLLAEAIRLARASPAEFFLLFGVAKLYSEGGFKPVRNPMIWTDMRGAWTGPVKHRQADSLMVLPLGTEDWDETAVLDLLGAMF